MWSPCRGGHRRLSSVSGCPVQLRRVLCAAGCALLVCAGPGCGDQESGGGRGEGTERSTAVGDVSSSVVGEEAPTTRSQSGGSADSVADDRQATDPSDFLEGRDGRRLPNGTVIYPAPSAKDRVVRPSDTCDRTRVRQRDGDTRRVTVPPAPGVRARQEDDRVLVTVEPGAPPSRCEPSFARVSVDNSDDPYPPLGRDVQLEKGAPRTVAIRLIPQVRTVDTARAYVGADDGRVSPTSRVMVMGSGR